MLSEVGGPKLEVYSCEKSKVSSVDTKAAARVVPHFVCIAHLHILVEILAQTCI